MANLDLSSIRKAIHGNNLLWSCTFFDKLIITPNYELTYSGFTDTKFMSSAQILNIPSQELETEIRNIEKYYTSKSKPVCIYLDPSTTPLIIEKILLDQGYQEDKSQEEVWWGVELNSVGSEIVPNPDLVIKECISKELFDDHLEAALKGYGDFDAWAEQLKKNFGKSKPDVKILHYTGYINDEPVSCSSLGVYDDQAYLINTAVVPEHRKKGIHTSMMLQRIEDSKKLGAKIAFYQTDFDNEASIATGRRVGFAEAFRRKLFYKDII